MRNAIKKNCKNNHEVVKSKKKKEAKSQLISQVYFLFNGRFGRVSSVHHQPLMMKEISYKYYNKQILTRDQEESKLNSTIIANSDAHKL